MQTRRLINALVGATCCAVFAMTTGCSPDSNGIDTADPTVAKQAVTAPPSVAQTSSAPVAPSAGGAPSAAGEPTEPTARNTGPSNLAREVYPIKDLTIPPTPPPATKNPPVVSPEQEVVMTAYRRFLKARTFTRLSPLDAESIMSPYAAKEELQNIINRRYSATKDRRRYFGAKVHRPGPPKIDGTTATLLDCRDLSSYLEVDSYGDQDITDSNFSMDHMDYKVKLEVIEGVWKVVKINFSDYKGEGCQQMLKNGWYQ